MKKYEPPICVSSLAEVFAHLAHKYMKDEMSWMIPLMPGEIDRRPFAQGTPEEISGSYLALGLKVPP